MADRFDSGAPAPFPTTRASAVRGIASEREPERERAWEVLAEAYWKPVYKHLRLRWRRSPEDAEDLTQAFFAEALRRGLFADYDPEKARFRTYVRVCLDRFASNDRRDRARLKRGGGVEIRSLDAGLAEEELAHVGDDGRSAEARFDRELQRSVFALSVEALTATREELRDEARSLLGVELPP